MANTAVDAANSRRCTDAGWPVADHRICRTYCRVYRDIMDVDLDRAGGIRKSIDAERSLRCAGERSLLDRMRDHGVDPRANDSSRGGGFQTAGAIWKSSVLVISRVASDGSACDILVDFERIELRSSSAANTQCNHF